MKAMAAVASPTTSLGEICMSLSMPASLRARCAPVLDISDEPSCMGREPPSRAWGMCMQNSCIPRSLEVMATEILQVRDVPSEDAQALRARAAAKNMSLSSYLRELIHDDASRAPMAEVLERIASRDGVDAEGEDIRALIDDQRR